MLGSGTPSFGGSTVSPPPELMKIYRNIKCRAAMIPSMISNVIVFLFITTGLSKRLLYVSTPDNRHFQTMRTH